MKSEYLSCGDILLHKCNFVRLPAHSSANFRLSFSDFLGCPTFSCIKSEAENLWLSLRSKYSSNTKRFKFLGSMLTQDEFGLDPGHRDVGVALSGLTLHLVSK